MAALLKSIWQVPLLPGVGDHSWSFPSGHTLSVAMFWPLVFYFHWGRDLRTVVLSLSVLILQGIGVCIHGYHVPEDVIAAIGFSVPIMLLFEYFWEDDCFYYFTVALIALVSYYSLPKQFAHLMVTSGVFVGLGLYDLLVRYSARFHRVFSQLPVLCLLACGVGSALLFTSISGMSPWAIQVFCLLMTFMSVFVFSGFRLHLRRLKWFEKYMGSCQQSDVPAWP